MKKKMVEEKEKGKSKEEASETDKSIIDRLWEIELILLAILVFSVGTLMTIVIRGF